MLIDNKEFSNFFNLKFLNEYCSGIFSDELDKLGYKNQVINGLLINKSKLRMFGKIRTLIIETMDTPDENIKMGLNFLASLNNGEILFVKGSNEFAYFGELMSRLSQEIGLSGIVIDGLTRDTFYTQNINLPIFAKGYSPKDIKGRGRVKEVDVDFFIDNIKISSGDYIFGDNDACVILPKNIISELAKKINIAVEEEYNIKQMIFDGKTISDILQVAKEF
ncbi:RraA family protein [Campylobacter volucris]|uniref:RraA family protein n=1 Tax=Campylobacter volucris TaxID=1031542 RepID=UPI001059E6FD|nr:RraA family protein [Campylobacter volucris]TDJ82102.1 RraA family protein [Campylobacter volucris]